MHFLCFVNLTMHLIPLLKITCLHLTNNIFVPIHILGDAYNTEERIVVAGYDNGDIKMFDLKKMAVRWETNVKNGVHCTSLV